MKRTHYRNCDEITLACGCDGCSPIRINGVLCHEHGCPDAWRDEQRKCVWCGTPFYPPEQFHLYCSPCCAASDAGAECDCDSCRELREAVDYEDAYPECSTCTSRNNNALCSGCPLDMQDGCDLDCSACGVTEPQDCWLAQSGLC